MARDVATRELCAEDPRLVWNLVVVDSSESSKVVDMSSEEVFTMSVTEVNSILDCKLPSSHKCASEATFRCVVPKSRNHLWYKDRRQAKQLLPNKKMHLQVHCRIYLSHKDTENCVAKRDPKKSIFIQQFMSKAGGLPRFPELQQFCIRMDTLLESAPPTEHIIVLANTTNSLTLTSACFLVGAYMIWHLGIQLDTVSRAFDAVSDRFVGYHHESWGQRVTVSDCWQALDRAVRLGWIVDSNTDTEPVLEVDEYEHYAGLANGSVHMVVPGTLFLFPTPDDLPGDAEWAVCEGEDGGTVRRFSPRYYASLFADLGVTAAGSLTCTAPWAARALAAGGIEVLDLGIESMDEEAMSDEGALLGALEGLLTRTASKAGRGTVAVHSGRGGEWPSWIGVVVAGVLMGRLGFGEGAARAWIGMLCPWMLREARPAKVSPSAAVAGAASFVGTGLGRRAASC